MNLFECICYIDLQKNEVDIFQETMRGIKLSVLEHPWWKRKPWDMQISAWDTVMQIVEKHKDRNFLFSEQELFELYKFILDRDDTKRYMLLDFDFIVAILLK